MLRLLITLCLLLCASLVQLACTVQGGAVPIPLGDESQNVHGVATSILPAPDATPTPTSTPFPLPVAHALTQQAIAHAAETAWASITPTLAPPTVTPTPGGIDLTDANAWTRHTDATGISFEHLYDHVVSYFDPRMYRLIELSEIPPDKIGAANIYSTSFYSATESLPEMMVDRYFTVVTWRGGESGDSLVYPFNLGPSGSFASLLQLEGATRAWLSIEGSDIQAWLYNEKCQLEIRFNTDSGYPGPINDGLSVPLHEVVAEHFPVFDHMFRSVQFPSGCGGERSPAPVNWVTHIDVTGVTFDYPVGASLPDMGHIADDSMNGAVTELRPGSESGNNLHETVIIQTWRSKDLNTDSSAITDYWPPSRGHAVHYPVEFELQGATKTLLFLIGDFPATNPTFNDAWLSRVYLNAAFYNEQCQILVLFWGGNGMVEVDKLPHTPLDQLVAEDFPIFDHMYRSVRFPPECGGEPAPMSPLPTPSTP